MNNKNYILLKNKIKLNSTKYWLPNNHNKINVNSDSWFDIKEIISPTKNEIIDVKLKIKKINKLIKCEKIKIYPTKKQRKILLIWMHAYVKMYNDTLKIIKNRKREKKKTILNWKTLRTTHLKDKKTLIIKSTKGKSLKYKSQVNSHVLDGAIHDACSKVKTCITNLYNRHINHFRLRYLKQSKHTKVLKIEKNFINSKINTFCPSIFNESFKLMKTERDKHINFKLKNINSDFTIHYNSLTNEFTLLSPISINQIKKHNKKETISLDPGIRTFQTGYSNNKCVEIGNNLRNTLLKYIKKIDSIKKSSKSKKIKKKVERKNYKKINNCVNDLHWKSINYLINNFGNIIIGNLSTKNIVKNNSNNNIDKVTKRVSLLMRLYQFKQRLSFKCNQHMIGYKEINEAYTSKTCTNCGNLKNDLGSAKVFNCNNCNISINRDINGARNILLKSLN